MARLGSGKFSDLIGRANLLDTKKGIEHWKAKGLDFSKIFRMPDMPGGSRALTTASARNHGLERRWTTG